MGQSALIGFGRGRGRNGKRTGRRVFDGSQKEAGWGTEQNRAEKSWKPWDSNCLCTECLTGKLAKIQDLQKSPCTSLIGRNYLLVWENTFILTKSFLFAAVMWGSISCA